MERRHSSCTAFTCIRTEYGGLEEVSFGIQRVHIAS